MGLGFWELRVGTVGKLQLRDHFTILQAIIINPEIHHFLLYTKAEVYCSPEIPSWSPEPMLMLSCNNDEQ